MLIVWTLVLPFIWLLRTFFFRLFFIWEVTTVVILEHGKFRIPTLVLPTSEQPHLRNVQETFIEAMQAWTLPGLSKSEWDVRKKQGSLMRNGQDMDEAELNTVGILLYEQTYRAGYKYFWFFFFNQVFFVCVYFLSFPFFQFGFVVHLNRIML